MSKKVAPALSLTHTSRRAHLQRGKINPDLFANKQPYNTYSILTWSWNNISSNQARHNSSPPSSLKPGESSDGLSIEGSEALTLLSFSYPKKNSWHALQFLKIVDIRCRHDMSCFACVLQLVFAPIFSTLWSWECAETKLMWSTEPSRKHIQIIEEGGSETQADHVPPHRPE